MIHEALGPDDRGQARPAQRLARQARGVARQGRVALAARGLAVGEVLTQEGKLVASTAQQGLMRKRRRQKLTI